MSGEVGKLINELDKKELILSFNTYLIKSLNNLPITLKVLEFDTMQTNLHGKKILNDIINNVISKNIFINNIMFNK